jgi:hypothetical protein
MKQTYTYLNEYGIQKFRSVVLGFRFQYVEKAFSRQFRAMIFILSMKLLRRKNSEGYDYMSEVFPIWELILIAYIRSMNNKKINHNK